MNTGPFCLADKDQRLAGQIQRKRSRDCLSQARSGHAKKRPKIGTKGRKTAKRSCFVPFLSLHDLFLRVSAAKSLKDDFCRHGEGEKIPVVTACRFEPPFSCAKKLFFWSLVRFPEFCGSESHVMLISFPFSRWSQKEEGRRGKMTSKGSFLKNKAAFIKERPLFCRGGGGYCPP